MTLRFMKLASMFQKVIGTKFDCSFSFLLLIYSIFIPHMGKVCLVYQKRVTEFRIKFSSLICSTHQWHF